MGENDKPFVVYPTDEDGVCITDFSGQILEILPSIQMIDSTIKLLKSIRKKGQEYIDLHNYKVWKEWEEKINTPIPKSPRRLQPGYIYFAGKDDYIKIGRTSGDPNKRVDTLNSNYPVDSIKLLHIIKSGDTAKHEKEFHDYFADKRVKGEWFKLTEEDIEMIKEIKEI